LLIENRITSDDQSRILTSDVKCVRRSEARGRHNRDLVSKPINVSFPFLRVLLALAALSSAFAVLAADLPPDVLARNRWMDLTRADYDKALARVPENLREEFSTSPKRVQDVLNNLLVEKTLAAQARADGTRPAPFTANADPDPQRALAAAEIQRIESDAAKSFDAHKASFEAKAREIYDLDREKYRVPEEIRLSDIAVKVADRGDGAALARAREARRRVISGASFADVAREYSDDPVTADKGGALPFVTAKDLAPAYAKAVFALSTVGEISEPIRAPAAYHVVRLEERRPARVKTFDEVRESMMQALRERYITDQRDARIRAVHEDPQLQLNQASIDALVIPVDPRAFIPSTTGSPPSAPPRAAAPAAR
jgi:peptidyl-prolyl cis-trans isomerase C